MQLVSLHAVSQAKIHCQSLVVGITDVVVTMAMGSFSEGCCSCCFSMTVRCLATRLKIKLHHNTRGGLRIRNNTSGRLDMALKFI
jgi:hypothetical protein